MIVGDVKLIFCAKDFCSVSKTFEGSCFYTTQLMDFGWLIFVSAGQAVLDGTGYEPLLVEEGQLILPPPDTTFSLTGTGKAVGIQFCGQSAFALAAVKQPYLHSSAALPGVAEAVSVIAQTGQARPEEAFALLCRLESFDMQAAPLPSLTAAAVMAIRKNYASLYGVEELAQSLEVSKSHLVRSFKAAMGVTPGVYLTEVRLLAARQLLASTDCSVELIAQMCGFSGANYFVRVFREKVGMTPAVFRSSQHLFADHNLVSGEIYL